MKPLLLFSLILFCSSCTLYQSEGAKCLQEGTDICSAVEVSPTATDLALESCREVETHQTIVPTELIDPLPKKVTTLNTQVWIENSNKILLLLRPLSSEREVLCELVLDSTSTTNLTPQIELVWSYSDIWLQHQP